MCTERKVSNTEPKGTGGVPGNIHLGLQTKMFYRVPNSRGFCLRKKMNPSVKETNLSIKNKNSPKESYKKEKIWKFNRVANYKYSKKNPIAFRCTFNQ